MDEHKTKMKAERLNKFFKHNSFKRNDFNYSGALVVLSFFFSLLCLYKPCAAENNLWPESENGAKEPLVELNLPSFAPVIEKLGPSVVNISTEGKETLSPNQPRGNQRFGAPDQGDENQRFPFEFFFQLPPEMNQRSFKTHSLGSGFIINPSGYIVTNNHVVDKATKILVTLKDDKRSYEAKVVGKDLKTDLALLKIEVPYSLPYVVVGNSDETVPGDWVIAIGNPFRLGHTVTVGIVSAKGRKVPGGGPYDDFIQTDASINPGNSGGPLFNSHGEVIGVNSAIFSPGRMGSSGFNIGIGFAIPSNLAKKIITQLHERGSVTRGWLGVLIQPVSQDMADALKLENAKGALVADVMEESPAAKAGIRRGDVIIEYDGREVIENDHLPLMVAETPIGKTVSIKYIRQGKSETVKVAILKLVDKEDSPTQVPQEENELGLTVQEITPDIVSSLGLSDDKGVIVSQVVPDSAAESSGIMQRDVILEVDSKPVNAVKEFRQAIKGIKKNKPLLLLIRRNENTIFLTLKVE